MAYGEGAPDHTRAIVAQEDISGKIEEHFNNAVPTVEVLDARSD